MKLLTRSFLFVVALAATAFAQTGEGLITGRVTDVRQLLTA